MITYFSLPAAQRKTQQIADQFNAAEELWSRLAAKWLGRRELYSDLSPELQIQFDLLEFAMAQSPKDCIGFVVEPKSRSSLPTSISTFRELSKRGSSVRFCLSLNA